MLIYLCAYNTFEFMMWNEDIFTDNYDFIYHKIDCYDKILIKKKILNPI